MKGTSIRFWLMFATFKLKSMDNDKDIDMRYNDTVILEKT